MILRHTCLCSVSSFLLLSLAGVGVAAATEVDAKVDFRYRLESVAQDNALEDALASTLRSRVTLTAQPQSGWSLVAELDHVSAVGGDTYNSTDNGKSSYSVAADPTGTDINQAFVRYESTTGTAYTAGRQRVNQLNQRFIGGVGWRQNEQTFDGYRVQSQWRDSWTLDIGYYHNVNRIFGPDGAGADQNGSFVTALANWRLQPNQQLALFGYDFEFDDWQVRSSRTYGVDYQSDLWGQRDLRLHVTLAAQNDAHSAPDNSTHHYHRIVLDWQPNRLKFSLGQERLAGDGTSAFQTPLATLHAFSGFADVFLTTPAAGLRDNWISVGTEAFGGKWKLSWHDFQSDAGALNYGQELDLVGAYRLSPRWSGIFKAAGYQGDAHGVDTTKLWLMLSYSLSSGG